MPTLFENTISGGKRNNNNKIFIHLSIIKCITKRMSDIIIKIIQNYVIYIGIYI